MRIALINPKTNTRYPQPSLGLLSIATVCQQLGHSVRIIDASAKHIPVCKIVEQVNCDDVVGITAMSLTYPEAMIIARAIRKAYPYKFMVMGGVHATVATGEVVRADVFDAVVVGEGEIIISSIIKKQKRAIYWDRTLVNLDDLPPLAYELLDGFRPKMSYGWRRAFMPVVTARGCPFQCSFCSKALFGSKYRVQSVEKVVSEIERLRRGFGFQEVKFYDDVFTMDKARAVELSQRIANSVAWTCMTRVNLVDRATLKAMKDGGCYCIAYGIESADPNILKSISKNITVEQIEQAVRYSKEVGMRVIGYFMLGAPGETMRTIEKTVDYAIQLDLDHAQFSIATALPGSELYTMVPNRLRANAYALNGVDNPSLCELSPKQLQDALKQANKRFDREAE